MLVALSIARAELSGEVVCLSNQVTGYMLSPTDVPTFILTDAAGNPVFEQAAPIGYLTVLPGGTPPPFSSVPKHSKANTYQLTSIAIGTGVHLGATPSQVVAVLDSRHVEHTGYSVDSSKGRFLTAVSRDRSSWHLMGVDHVVEFRLDSSDRLSRISPEII